MSLSWTQMKKEWNFHDESDTHCLPEFQGLGGKPYLSFASVHFGPYNLCIISIG